MKTIVVISLFCIFITRSWGSEVAADLVREPVELEDKEIVKRQASPAPRPKTSSNNYTSVRTKHGCKLYALDVIFFKKTSKGDAGQYVVEEVSVPGTSLKSIDEGTCGNNSGTIILDYGGPLQKGLESLTLTFNISYLKAFGWWELSSLEVDANGQIAGGRFHETFEGNVMKSVAIGASKRFSYACGRPPALHFSKDEKYTTVYGIKFRNLQIQPFEWKRSPGNFTNDVDDCVPFFSIGIWMFLVVAAVLLLVVFFGIGMISSLKTMDRFDDPKGKPLVINAKE